MAGEGQQGNIAGLAAMGAGMLGEYRKKLTPYVRQKAAEALAQSNGDQEAAAKLLTQWARKDDALWRQLREPMERRGHQPLLLRAALLDAESV